MVRAIFIIIVLFFNLIALNSCDIFCSELFCQTYRERKGCVAVSIGCQVQNETYNGEAFPAAEPCNCCDVCLENLNEGDYCTIGSSDTAPPLYACGPGLFCSLDGESDYKCKKMDSTVCFKEQIKYDADQLQNEVGSYMVRPKCDGDGNYRPIKCNPGQTCFCVDDDGKRIFGEASYTLLTELTMNCECSRLNDKLSKIIESRIPVITARCLEDGSFDPLQCMGDQCMCVERSTGSSASDTFNITVVSYTQLPCYNNTIHRSWIYSHKCEVIQNEGIYEIQKSEAEGYSILDFRGEKCQPDGWFVPVQQNRTHRFCVDKYGRNLGNFAISKDAVGGEEINCLCARTIDIIQNDQSLELPQCCPNGNFRKVQCRTGKCFCVEKNGLQTTKEVDEMNISILNCYNNGKYC